MFLMCLEQTSRFSIAHNLHLEVASNIAKMSWQLHVVVKCNFPLACGRKSIMSPCEFRKTPRNLRIIVELVKRRIPIPDIVVDPCFVMMEWSFFAEKLFRRSFAASSPKNCPKTMSS